PESRLRPAAARLQTPFDEIWGTSVSAMIRRRARTPRRTSLRRLSLACVGAYAAWSTHASAQAPSPQPTPPPATTTAPIAPGTPPAPIAPPPPPPPPSGTSPKRPAFDYDGRTEPTTPGDVLIWVPRILFFPVYLVTEFVIRRPLGFLMVSAERGRWIEAV